MNILYTLGIILIGTIGGVLLLLEVLYRSKEGKKDKPPDKNYRRRY